MLRLFAVLMILFIVVNLAWGLYSLVRDRSKSTRTVRALTWRIAASLVLFLVIVALAFFGVFPVR